jgi:hypothetical protein
MLVISNNAQAHTDKACLSYAIFRESSGQGILTQRAVMDIVINRARKFRKSICEVLHQEGQFPYFVDGVKPVPKKFLTRVEFVSTMQPVLDKSYMYFNDVPLSYGKKSKLKIGGLYFS